MRVSIRQALRPLCLWKSLNFQLFGKVDSFKLLLEVLWCDVKSSFIRGSHQNRRGTEGTFHVYELLSAKSSRFKLNDAANNELLSAALDGGFLGDGAGGKSDSGNAHP